MIKYFNVHDRDFSSLNKTMRNLQKSEMIRIRKGRVQPENLEARREFEIIRSQMQNLGIIGIDSFTNSTDYITYSWGLSITGGSKALFTEQGSV